MKIAIIPARGGSERIKLKNIIQFYNQPIIYYSIEVAKRSKIFDKIYVSTDSKKILNVCKKLGIETLTRSKKLSDKHTGIVDVMKYEIEKNFLKYKASYFCCIFPASPFIKKKKLIDGYNKIKTKKYDYVFSACKFNGAIERAFNVDSKNKISINKKNQNSFKKKNNYKKSYFDSAQFYWAQGETWIKKKKIFSNKSSIIETDEIFTCDIDNKEDLKKAKKLFKIYE